MERQIRVTWIPLLLAVALCDCIEAPREVSWIPIPGGRFMMGSPDGEGEEDEHPRHPVDVPSFEMSETEVTVHQYGRCVKAGECLEPLRYDPDWANGCNFGRPGREDHPLVCVNWYQSSEFCAWLGGWLPSEAEWMYAARSGGKDVTYPWGEEEPSCDLLIMHDRELGFGCGFDAPAPVCSRPEGNTEQGLCDMAGNLWEWIQDRYHISYEGAPADGRAWVRGSIAGNVECGGSWVDSAGKHHDYYYFRVHDRDVSLPDNIGAASGFRCAREPSALDSKE